MALEGVNMPNPYAPRGTRSPSIKDISPKVPEVEEFIVPEWTVVVPEGSVKEILNWVDEDKERAQLALDAEETGKARKSLIDAMKEILA